MEYPPSSLARLNECQPIYEELPGWKEPTSHIRHVQDLPANAIAYVRRLETLIGAPVSMLSVGPRRDENIIVRPAL